jgi:5'-deoxynucleotidase YfbR-like HD superfamily hydrolase
MTWIRTYPSGEAFDLLNVNPDSLQLTDIVQALSHICRFGGHTKEFYSVLQHSVLVGEIVFGLGAVLEMPLPDMAKLIRTALLHDASEAYIGDLVRPLKRASDLGPIFKQIEDPLQRAISEKFGLLWPFPEIIHKADDIALMTEARDLLDDDTDRWNFIRKDIEPMRARISPNATFKDVRMQFWRAWSAFGGGDVSQEPGPHPTT